MQRVNDRVKAQHLKELVLERRRQLQQQLREGQAGEQGQQLSEQQRAGLEKELAERQQLLEALKRGRFRNPRLRREVALIKVGCGGAGAAWCGVVMCCAVMC